MTGPREVQWRRFCETMAPQRDELERRAALCRALWPQDCALTMKTAGELRENTFLFQLPWDMEQTYQPVHFENGIDWGFVLNGDQEFTFQMNRHRYWICLGQAYALTGDETYAECFVNQLTDWIEKEPWRKDAADTTWRTLDAGLRADYWVRAMALCARSAAVTPQVVERFLEGLEIHANRLAENPRIGFSTKSNWGVMEYTGLYMVAWLLNRPEDVERARLFLRKALHTQFMDDGMQWEASPMYHNEVLMSTLEALRLARLWGDILFSQEEIEIIRKAAYATMLLQTPAHHQPMVGDSDDTDVRDILTQAALLLEDGVLKGGAFDRLDYESIWLLGAEEDVRYQSIAPQALKGGVTELSSSGQVILRTGWDIKADWLYFKNGPLGGGHGHQDKLHVGLWLDGEEILTDGGRYTYTDTQERYWLKSAAAHNVPLADAEEYADSIDSWGYRTLPQSLPNRVCHKGEYFFVEGSHTGYVAQGILLCRRILVVSSDIFVINDTWIGRHPRETSQHFHFAETVRLNTTSQGLEGIGATSRFSMQFFAQEQFVRMKLGTAPLARHYNKMKQVPDLTVNAENCGAMTTILVRRRDTSPVRITPQSVYNEAYSHELVPQQAEGFVIEANGRRQGVVFLYQDVGNTEDYNGICGAYGLGRVMACDLNQASRQMIVLQW